MIDMCAHVITCAVYNMHVVWNTKKCKDMWTSRWCGTADFPLFPRCWLLEDSTWVDQKGWRIPTRSMATLIFRWNIWKKNMINNWICWGSFFERTVLFFEQKWNSFVPSGHVCFAELVLHACPMMYRDRSICLMVFAYFYERSQGIDSCTTNPTLINVVGAVLQLVIVTHNHIYFSCAHTDVLLLMVRLYSLNACERQDVDIGCILGSRWGIQVYIDFGRHVQRVKEMCVLFYIFLQQLDTLEYVAIMARECLSELQTHTKTDALLKVMRQWRAIFSVPGASTLLRRRRRSDSMTGD